VFEWTLKQGGVSEMEKLNQKKSQKLYDLIDNSEFYQNKIKPSCRSKMNIPFTVGASDLDTQFLEDASKRNLMHLNGFRMAGGMRASLYNAVTEEAVDALIEFMADFEKKYA
jgi:phosphoserine aminotransferase